MRKTEPLPYYRWYWREHRGSRKVQRLSPLERGLHRELLDEQWEKGWIPDDIEKLAEICDCPVEMMCEAWPNIRRCYEPIEDDPSKLINSRLERERTETDSKRAACARAGLASANAKHASTDVDEGQQPSTGVSGRYIAVAGAEQEHEQVERTDAHGSEGTKPEPLKPPESDPPYDPDFDGQIEFNAFVDLFPFERRVYDDPVAKAFFSALGEIRKEFGLSDPQAVEWLRSRTLDYLAGLESPRFCKSIMNYLGAKPWRDTAPKPRRVIVMETDEQVSKRLQAEARVRMEARRARLENAGA